MSRRIESTTGNKIIRPSIACRIPHVRRREAPATITGDSMKPTAASATEIVKSANHIINQALPRELLQADTIVYRRRRRKKVKLRARQVALAGALTGVSVLGTIGIETLHSNVPAPTQQISLAPTHSYEEALICPPEKTPSPPPNAISLETLIASPQEFFGKGNLLVPIKIDDLGSLMKPEQLLTILDTEGLKKTIKASTTTLSTEIDGKKRYIKVFSDVTSPNALTMLDFIESVKEETASCEQNANILGQVVKISGEYALKVSKMSPPEDGIIRQTAHSLAKLITNPDIAFGSDSQVNLSNIPAGDFVPAVNSEPLNLSLSNLTGVEKTIRGYTGKLTEQPRNYSSNEQIVYVIPMAESAYQTIFNPATGLPRQGKVDIKGRLVRSFGTDMLKITSAKPDKPSHPKRQ